MSKIQKITIDNATITINDAITLHFNHNKCYKIDAPYIFATGYRCKKYILLHEMQGYSTDKAIEPTTSKQFTDGLLTMDNPYYVDFYHMLHDKISIESNNNSHFLLPRDSFNGDIFPYRNKDLDSFHLFKVNEDSWTEIDLDLDKMEDKELIEWRYFTNTMIKV